MEQIQKRIRQNCIGRTVTDQFYVDGDVNVPDAKSDVGRIILGEGRLRVEEVKLAEHYARVTGKLVYQILYVSEGEGPKLMSLQGKIPFEEMIYLEEDPESQLYVRVSSVDLTVSVINSRKLNVKAMVELELCSEGEKEQILTLDLEEEEGVYKKKKAENLLKLHMVKKDICRIKEEVRLPGTKENIGTILWTKIAARKLDTRVSQDAILLRGELQVFLFYESQEGQPDWAEQMVPYEARVECLGAEDTMFHRMYAELTDSNMDVRMDEDGEMRVLGIEATLELRIAVYEEEQIELLQDVYALHKECKPVFEEIHMESLVMQNHSKAKVTEQLSLPELKNNMLQICHSGGYLQLEHTEIVPEGILAEGVLQIYFLYVRADDAMPFDIWQGMIPFSEVIESNEIANDMKYDMTGTLEQINVGFLGSDEVEVKAVLAFQVFIRQPQTLENIAEITMEETDMEALSKAPGIVGYVVKEGDDLWNLAKRYSTTEEGIAEMNHLTERKLKQGDKLLIFRENLSIL